MEQNAVASSSRGPPHSPIEAKRKRSRRNYDVEDRTTKTDVGSSPGTCWTLSSYKPGSGVAELRSPDLTKLWQSDGNQPHLINIQFARRTCVTHLSIYLDVKQDDSYTPTKIAVRGGTNFHDLTLVRQRTFDTPQGWKHFDMTMGSVDAATNEEDEVEDAEGEGTGAGGEIRRKAEEGEDDDEGEGSEGIRVWLLQMCILANHLNGKDTHIRRLVVFGPKASSTPATHPTGLKRGAANGLTHSLPPARARGALSSSANGQDVTLAQLLALQSAADRGADGEGEDEEGGPARRTGLNLFGNIR